jgi:hypothetical protein
MAVGRAFNLKLLIDLSSGVKEAHRDFFDAALTFNPSVAKSTSATLQYGRATKSARKQIRLSMHH